MFGWKSFREPEMVRVPRGRFLMGSPADEPGSDNDEGPQHEVLIGYDFEVGKYPVTFAEWDAATAEGVCGGYRPDDERWGRRRRPVIHVSWNDVQEYISWLNERTGRRYRLLSEAEWEYCCRAGTTTMYSFGDSVTWPLANFANKHTVPVDRFPANQFGLVGMHGNMWEWCQDCWNDNYKGAPMDGSAWEKGDCGRRVLRGGSWVDNSRNLRSASRFRRDAINRDDSDGFRLARTL